MRRQSEKLKTDVRMRMSPSQRQSVTLICNELDIHKSTPQRWRRQFA
jgi:transposase-like protein